jgi:hypothetical protein
LLRHSVGWLGHGRRKGAKGMVNYSLSDVKEEEIKGVGFHLIYPRVRQSCLISICYRAFSEKA